jgi:hypothetical protein
MPKVESVISIFIILSKVTHIGIVNTLQEHSIMLQLFWSKNKSKIVDIFVKEYLNSFAC